jgi:hypothetical protein
MNHLNAPHTITPSVLQPMKRNCCLESFKFDKTDKCVSATILPKYIQLVTEIILDISIENYDGKQFVVKIMQNNVIIAIISGLNAKINVAEIFRNQTNDLHGLPTIPYVTKSPTKDGLFHSPFCFEIICSGKINLDNSQYFLKGYILSPINPHTISWNYLVYENIATKHTIKRNTNEIVLKCDFVMMDKVSFVVDKPDDVKFVEFWFDNNSYLRCPLFIIQKEKVDGNRVYEFEFNNFYTKTFKHFAISFSLHEDNVDGIMVDVNFVVANVFSISGGSFVKN